MASKATDWLEQLDEVLASRNAATVAPERR
jgi:hypothetical protein